MTNNTMHDMLQMKAFQKNHSLVQQENSKLETVKHEAESRMKNLQEEVYIYKYY